VLLSILRLNWLEAVRLAICSDWYLCQRDEYKLAQENGLIEDDNKLHSHLKCCNLFTIIMANFLDIKTCQRIVPPWYGEQLWKSAYHDIVNCSEFYLLLHSTTYIFLHASLMLLWKFTFQVGAWCCWKEQSECSRAIQTMVVVFLFYEIDRYVITSYVSSTEKRKVFHTHLIPW